MYADLVYEANLPRTTPDTYFVRCTVFGEYQRPVYEDRLYITFKQLFVTWQICISARVMVEMVEQLYVVFNMTPTLPGNKT